MVAHTHTHLHAPVAGHNRGKRVMQALLCEGQELAGLVPVHARVEEVELWTRGSVDT